MMSLRIAFLGQNVIDSIGLLSVLHATFTIAAVVESAPRKADLSYYGGAHRAEFKRRSKLMRFARRKNVPYFLLTNLRTKELAEFLYNNKIDLMCVVSMAGLLREPALSAPRLGVLGYHPSILPNYRGPNPWFWQYYFMEKEAGVSIFFLDSGEDSGDIVYQESLPLALGMPFPDLHQKCVDLGGKLLAKAIFAILENRCPRQVQKHISCPFRARGIDRSEPLIEWHIWPIQRVWHVLRGTLKWLDPTPSIPASIISSVGQIDRTPTKLEAGTIGEDSDGFFFAHNEGRIRVKLNFPNGQSRDSIVSFTQIRADRFATD